MNVVDLFCGAGGLSLGFRRAGHKVVLANEYSVDAEWTYRANHLPEELSAMLGNIPDWAQEPGFRAEVNHRHLVREILMRNRDSEGTKDVMRGGDIRKVLRDQWLTQWNKTNESPDVIVGGPPCQGFSSARGRLVNDERNKLVLEYLRVVKCLHPKALVIENVPGMVERHAGVVRHLGELLVGCGYIPRIGIVATSDFGVPQSRKRVLIMAIRADLLDLECHIGSTQANDALLASLIPVGCPVSRPCGHPSSRSPWARIAAGQDQIQHVLGDLCTSPPNFKDVNPHGVAYRQGFTIAKLSGLPRELRTNRDVYLAGQVASEPEDFVASVHNHEITSHSPNIRDKFARLQTIAFINPERRCHSGFLREQLCSAFDGKMSEKTSQRVLVSGFPPDVTITSLPDDLIHYEEPRILSVRECARIQTFPDWYLFRGVRTSGFMRRREGTFVPQYTQVANGVPPRVAHGIAQRLREVLSQVTSTRNVDPSKLCHGGYEILPETEAAEAILDLNDGFRRLVVCKYATSSYGVA